MKNIIFFTFLFMFSINLFGNDTIPHKPLADYAGRYSLPENQYAQSVLIKVKNDTLTAETDLGSIHLIQIGEDSFEVVEFNVQVKFIRDEKKRKVLGAKIIYTEGDIEIYGKKESD